MTLPNTIEVTRYEQNRFLTYPHANSFADGGESLVVGEYDGTGYALVKTDIATGRDVAQYPFPIKRTGHSLPAYDIARETNRLFFIDDKALWIIDLDAATPPQLVYRGDLSLIDIVSASADGTRVVGGAKAAEGYVGFEINIATGKATTTFEYPWWVNHVQYCPFDESIIGFCHEGPTEQIPQRVWAYTNGNSRCVFDQRWDDESTRLFVGHERWAFHDASVLAVAYGVSIGGPRGIYEAFTDNRPSRLVSEGNRDFHLDISRDGRWVAVDTTGPHDLPGKGWENAGPHSDVLIIDRTIGTRQCLARSTQNTISSHAHPVFSPDGRWIYYHQTDDNVQHWRVMKVANPWTD